MGKTAKTLTVQGDEYSNATACQVRHCGAKALWGNFTEEVIFESYWVGIPGRLRDQGDTELGTSTVCFGNNECGSSL